MLEILQYAVAASLLFTSFVTLAAVVVVTTVVIRLLFKKG